MDLKLIVGKKMIKIYCKDCKYYDAKSHHEISIGMVCKSPIKRYINTWYGKELIWESDKNKHNNCKDFVKKR